MSGQKSFKVVEIICILLILILLFSGFNLFLISDDIHKTPIIEPEALIQQTNPDRSDQPDQVDTLWHEIFNNSDNIKQRSTSRGNDSYDHDLAIKSVKIQYPGFLPWYVFYMAGEIGEPSVFSVTIENIGNKHVEYNTASMTINLTDYFGYSSWERKDYIGHLQPGNELTLNFTWIPTYSNSFNLTCNISFEGDQNQSNNIGRVFYLFTNKWTDDFEDGTIDDWTGNKDALAWHLTSTIENDPNPNAHTSSYALYHGLEDGITDDYGEKNNIEIITPEIDLRRFEKGAFLNFKFFGDSTNNKDKFTIKGYKNAEQKWETINIEFSGGKTINGSGLPDWNVWQSGVYIGISIGSYKGEITRFKIQWESDQTPEEKTGFYFDDFIIYGYERPLPDLDVGIESIQVLPSDKPILAGTEFTILANITNYGREPVSNLHADLSVKDFSGRSQVSTQFSDNTIGKLLPGKSEFVYWTIIPSVSGIYYFNISLDLDSDKYPQNNFITLEAVEVVKYYNSFEITDVDNDWLPQGNWEKTNVTNDPYPDDHTRTTAWLVGKADGNTKTQNISSILYSPVIDLEGARTNPLYKSEQIEISFNWLDRGSAEAKLYVEYAIDNSDNWAILSGYGPSSSAGIITGKGSDTWHSWKALDNTELFGHHVQLRWRLETESEPSQDFSYYIDDFEVWVVQEDFGRPEIVDCKATPDSIINDDRDKVEVSCEVIGYVAPIGEVFIDMEPIGGPKKQAMNENTNRFDVLQGYYVYDYNLTLSVPPTIPEGDHILTITALDTAGRSDKNYVKLQVRENLAPKIVEHTPINSTLIVFENEIVKFSIDAFDLEDLTDLDYEWYVNDSKIDNWNRDHFVFITDYHGMYSAGSYILEVVVLDHGRPNKTDRFQWQISVLDILPDFEIRTNEISLSRKNVTLNDTVEIEILAHNLQPPTEKNITIHFIQQSTNISIPDFVFAIYDLDTLQGNGQKFVTTTWKADLSCNYLKIWIDPEDAIRELNEENNYAVIKINVSLPSVNPPDPEPSENDTTTKVKVNYFYYILATGVTISILSLFIAVGTEIGNYRLYLMVAPLYSRITGNKILEHELRSKIYMHIRTHPGDHYRSIMMKLNIKNGTLVHHLARLEHEELIKSERDGYYKRFYPVGMKIPRSEVSMYYPDGMATYNIGEHQVSDIQIRIINAIRKHQGLTQKEIAIKVKESRRVVNYHIKLLMQHEIIKVVKVGRTTQCYTVEKVS